MPLRRRLRQRLIRWLGGNTDGMPADLAGQEMVSLGLGGDGQLVLPALDQAKQAMLAGRYFAHAEELIRRGAAEMAAPFYRQAFVLLRASQAGRGEAGDNSDFDDPITMNSVIDLGSPVPDAVTNEPVAPKAMPSTQVADVDAVIRSLQASLNADNADAVAQEVARLRQQGVQHPELDHLQGLIHLIKGESAAAAERFRLAIAQAPGHYRSLVNLAGLLVREQRLEEAQALLQKALEQVNPESELAVPALTNLSLVHQAAGQPMEEALLLLRIHRLKPGHVRPERLLNAAGVLQEMAEEPAAIELLQWLSDNQGGPEVWQPLATLLERRGDYQAAALVYRQLLQPQQAPPSGQQP